MPKFHFPLDPLIRHRRRIEDSRRQVLAALESERSGLEDRLRNIHAQIEAERQTLTGSLIGCVDTRLIRDHAVMSATLQDQAHRCAVRLADIYKRIEQARTALLEAAKARKSLQRLRETRYETWRCAIENREAAVLDDLVNARTARIQQETIA